MQTPQRQTAPEIKRARRVEFVRTVEYLISVTDMDQEEAFEALNKLTPAFPSYARFRSFKSELPNKAEQADPISSEISAIFENLEGIDGGPRGDFAVVTAKTSTRSDEDARFDRDETDRITTMTLNSIRDAATGLVINEPLLSRIVRAWAAAT